MGFPVLLPEGRRKMRNIEEVIQAVGRVIVGKEEVIRQILMTMLAGGHILLEDVPGTGKTTLALALTRTLGLTGRRIQFTPDVMPSDIVGYSIYDRESGAFSYHPGILAGTNLLLGDEINRTSSKTQSALLEAMEEGQVTVDGASYPLPVPFIVIATQNPLGSAGTHPLPQAQVDRFMVRLSIGYPDREAQMTLLRDRLRENPLEAVRPVLSLEEFLQLQASVRNVTIRDEVLEYIADLAVASRENEQLDAGISPRGTLFLTRMAKACAFMEGRDYVVGTDVVTVWHPVCDHRVQLSRRARLEGSTQQSVLGQVLSGVRTPDERL